MKRKCRKIKCVIKSIPTKQSVADDFIQKSEIREKRIGIIFKIIYVIAIFFASVFMLISNTYIKGLTDIYIIQICFAAFLFCILLYMIMYIFNELKCLKICSNDLPKAQEEKTEHSYSAIFEYFFQGGITALLCAFLLGIAKGKITRELMIQVTTISTIIAAVFSQPIGKRGVIFFNFMSHVFWTVTVIGILIAVAFVEV